MKGVIMNKDAILYGVIGLLAGAIIASFSAAYAVNNNHSSMMRMMGMHASTNSQGMMDNNDMTMSEMTDSLKGKTGDDFDKAFIEMMIAHHEGAVDMAELVPSRAKHDEIKTLGDAIITAQTKEIADMKKWQTDWGYSSDEMMDMMHGSH
jgi:uncharacterized protein (DUF305 family)